MRLLSGSWVVAVSAIVLAIVSSCSGGSDGDKGGGRSGWGDKTGEKKRDPIVETRPARVDTIARYERSTGRIQAKEVADVHARVSELAVSVRFEIGDHVSQGQELASLDRKQFELLLSDAEIALEEADLAHKKLELDLADTQAKVERILKYFDPEKPKESDLFSKEQYDAALLDRNKARNALDSQDLVLKKAKSEVERNRLQLSHATITAPISGVITERNIRENELVAASTIVFRIADFSQLEVVLDAAEASLVGMHEPERAAPIPLLGLQGDVKLETAQAALLSVTAFPGLRFLGYLDRISPTVSSERGMLSITVAILQPAMLSDQEHRPLLEQLDVDDRAAVMDTSRQAAEGRSLQLRPGMWVDARLSVEVRESALLVPGAALVGDAEVVWVVTPPPQSRREAKAAEEPQNGTGVAGVARRIDISGRRGVSSEGSFELLPLPEGDERTDIKPGDQIVVRGQSLLTDGQRVRAIDLSRR